MGKHREPLPDDLKELVRLCRQGNLFAVQEWIASGKRFQPPPGNFAIWPFSAAVDTGFHSLIEVFLRAGVEQREKDCALYDAVSRRRLDLVELLDRYGANLKTISAETLFEICEPTIFRWFIAHGLDLETGWPIAKAFRSMHRGLLSIYMDVRDTVPSGLQELRLG